MVFLLLPLIVVVGAILWESLKSPFTEDDDSYDPEFQREVQRQMRMLREMGREAQERNKQMGP